LATEAGWLAGWSW